MRTVGIIGSVIVRKLWQYLLGKRLLNRGNNLFKTFPKVRGHKKGYCIFGTFQLRDENLSETKLWVNCAENIQEEILLHPKQEHELSCDQKTHVNGS